MGHPYIGIGDMCRRFMARTHGNGLRDLQIPLDAKPQVWRNVS
jgi:hypothetical protein